MGDVVSELAAGNFALIDRSRLGRGAFASTRSFYPCDLFGEHVPMSRRQLIPGREALANPVGHDEGTRKGLRMPGYLSNSQRYSAIRATPDSSQ